MRGVSLLIAMLVVMLVAPFQAMAQQQAPEGGDQSQNQTEPSGGAPDSTHGGAEFGADPNAIPKLTVPGPVAVLQENGLAAAPADAPPQVQEAVWAANEIVGKPYRYGGGHARIVDTGYDCSGTISYALHGAGLLKRPLDSSSFMRWGERGKGQWITVYTNPGHAYIVIAGLRLDTSAAGERRSSGRGPRWRTSARPQRGFRVRHPLGF